MLAMVAGFTSCGDDNNGNNKGEDMTTAQTFAMSAKRASKAYWFTTATSPPHLPQNMPTKQRRSRSTM